MESSELKDIELVMELFSLEPFAWEVSKVVGAFKVKAPVLEILRALNESETAHIEFRINGKNAPFSSVKIGQEVSVEIIPPRGVGCCLVKDIDDLLKVGYLHELPSQYAVASENYLSWGAMPPPKSLLAINECSNFVREILGRELIESDSASKSFSLSVSE
jgi:hypothetical protein